MDNELHSEKKDFFQRIRLLLSLVVIIVLGVVAINYIPKELDNSELKIASFNIQILGKKKISNPVIRKTLISIIERYDIIFIQELRDKSSLSIKILLTELNKVNKDKYSMIVSKRLGSTRSKEQYVYFYNKDKVDLVDSFQYIGLKNDFERDPFSVKFKKDNMVFILTGVHIDPDKVVEELNSMGIVLDQVKRKLSTENVILLGDFNAECKYLPVYKLNNLYIKKDRNLVWFIDDSQDTTVNTNTDCAYDRIISTSNISKNITNANVYKFENDFNLTYKQALKVSDHYPVEFSLKIKNGLKKSVLFIDCKKKN